MINILVADDSSDYMPGSLESYKQRTRVARRESEKDSNVKALTVEIDDRAPPRGSGITVYGHVTSHYRGQIADLSTVGG